MNTFVSEAEAIHCARAKILNQDIHLPNQLRAQVSSRRLFQINGNSTLTAIQPQEKCRLLANEGWSPSAGKFSAMRLFQLVDLGAVIREQQSAVRAGERVREVKNADTSEGKLRFKNRA